MSRALVLFCLGLQALPARFTPEAVLARSVRPLEPGRRAVELWSEGHQIGTGVWLVDGDRTHLAVRNPLGQPTSVLRVADGAVSVELVGSREVVATDAARVLGDLRSPGPAALAKLVWGRVPSDAVAAIPLEGDYLVHGRGWVAVVDREGVVQHALSGSVAIRRLGDRVRLADPQGSGGTVELVLGDPEHTPVPARAFHIGSERAVPTISAQLLGRRAGRRLLGL